MELTATIRVSGDPEQLRDYRGRVRDLLDEEGVSGYRELHTEDRLEYRFRLRGGIPFPPFVVVSQIFPDLLIEVDWTEDALGRGGHAVIQNGRLREQTVSAHVPRAERLQRVRAASDGRLLIAIACARFGRGWHGCAFTAGEGAWVRIEMQAGGGTLTASDGFGGEWAERWTVSRSGSEADPRAGPETGDRVEYRELSPREPIAADELRALEGLTREFVGDWLWFASDPPEETAIERHRYANYGYRIREANLRSEKLRRVLQPEGAETRFDSFGPELGWIADQVERLWLRQTPDEETDEK